MTFNTIYTDFKKLFPEFKKKFEELEEKALIYGDNDGNEMSHISYGLIVMPLIHELLEKQDEERLKIAFNFFESMATSSDIKIQEVLEFTVLENLTTESKEIYDSSKKYIGPKTKELVNEVATYMDIEPMN